MQTGFPRHIAIIMDGNGRWAESRGKLRIQGHREGARNVRHLTIACSKTDLQILTLYAFSSENWSRPKREIDLLMKLLRVYAIRERPIFMENNVRLQVIGDWSRLPAFATDALRKTIELTSKNTGLVLQLALSYGSRDEIVRATRALASRVKAGELNPEDISENLLEASLDTAGQPAPDLMIRTGGELRISNYLLWQAAYAEFYFTEVMWPEFSFEELVKAAQAFHGRERRFGGVKA